MSIGKKILGIVSLLIACALGFQAFISTHMVGTELERSVTANMTAKAQATIDSFDMLLQAAQADLAVIGAHKAIENYLTYRVFGDEESMTESVAELELFLTRVFQGKPQYVNMQVVDRDGVVLHMTDGMRIEKYETYDSARAFELIDRAVASGKPAVSYAVRREGDSVALLSVAAVMIEDKAEALIWLYQPLGKALEALFSGASQNGLSVVISNSGNEIIAKSSGLAGAQSKALAAEELQGWLSIAQDLPALDWRVTFGAEESIAYAVVNELTMISSGVFVIALLISGFILVLFVRRIVNPLNKAVEVAESIASGDLSKDCEAQSRDETGQLLNAMKRMQINLKASIETGRRKAAETGRIKTALDNVSANVMVADADHNIIYVNPALMTMFREAQADIRKRLPTFDVDALMGASIDRFHKDPSRQRGLIESLSGTHNAQIEIANRTFRFTANPVVDDQGTRLGTVVEWADRTLELGVEEVVQDIVNAAQLGDLSKRLSLQGKDGFLLQLGQGLNALLEVSERVINDTLRVLGAMSGGDLTETITADYEGSFGQLKRDANATMIKLTEVIGNIKTGTDSVSTGAAEISQGNANLSQRTEEQAANLEETASSMEQMTATVKQNADNARQANQLASGAREQAEKGGQVVGDAVSAMGEISAASKKITDIIGVIDEIAFQTNLLALNAAVEAARAGEQGRGFAVVASEVRNLAQRSATAAKEIKGLIADSVIKVREGSKLVDQSGQTLKEIVNSVKRVSDIVAAIAAASSEQSAGIEEVNKSIMQMDDMTQQNAALVEQAASASEAMDEQARRMKDLVGFFKASE